MDFAADAPHGHLAFTDDGLVAYANAEALSLLGYDALENTRLDALMTVATKVFHQTHLFPLIRLQRRADEVFVTFKTKSGEQLPTLVNAARREAKDGAVNHFSFMVVRQRKKFEDELVQARRAAEEALRSNDELTRIKDELEKNKAALDKHLSRVEQKRREQIEYSTVISHDLNEPMRKIMIFADMLLHTAKSNLDERTANALSRIHDASARMRKLLDVMNLFLLVDAPDGGTTRVDLNDVLRRAERDVRDEFSNASWTLNAENLPTVEGHAGQLEMLFYHLLHNAVKFRVPERELAVDIVGDVLQDNRFRVLNGEYRYVDHARIAVADNGPGFSGNYNEKVFQLFQKLDNHAGSLGYGLALCRKIVMNHYGTIAANGNAGKGTTVSFTLPVTIS